MLICNNVKNMLGVIWSAVIIHLENNINVMEIHQIVGFNNPSEEEWSRIFSVLFQIT